MPPPGKNPADVPVRKDLLILQLSLLTLGGAGSSKRTGFFELGKVDPLFLLRKNERSRSQFYGQGAPD